MHFMDTWQARMKAFRAACEVDREMGLLPRHLHTASLRTLYISLDIQCLLYSYSTDLHFTFYHILIIRQYFYSFNYTQ